MIEIPVRFIEITLEAKVNNNHFNDVEIILPITIDLFRFT